MTRILLFVFISLVSVSNAFAVINADSLLQRKVDSLMLEEAKQLEEIRIADRERKADELAAEARERIDDASNLIEWGFGVLAFLSAVIAGVVIFGVIKSRKDMKAELALKLEDFKCKDMVNALAEFKTSVIEPETSAMIEAAKESIRLQQAELEKQQQELHKKIEEASKVRVEEVIRELRENAKRDLEDALKKYNEQYSPGQKLTPEAEKQSAELGEKAAIAQALGGEQTAAQFVARGHQHRAKKEWELALTAYDDALRLDPKNFVALFYRAYVLAEMRRHGASRDAYLAFLAAGPDRSVAIANNNLGHQYYALGAYDKALEAFDRAIELDYKLAQPWHSKGNLLRNKGKTAEALAAYEAAMALDTSGSINKLGRAGALMELGRTDEGRKLLEELLPVYKEPVEDAYNRACVYALLGNREKMLEELKIAKANELMHLDWVCGDPDFKAFREDPEFLEITGCGGKADPIP